MADKNLQGLAPLSFEAHSEIKLPGKFSDFSFAQEQSYIAVNMNELERLVCDLPVLFTEQGDVLALMGLQKGLNAFINKRGQWLGRSVPEVLQLHPFRIAESGEKRVLMIDENSPLVKKNEGKTLFKKNGEHSKFLEEKIERLGRFYQSQNQTRQIGRLFVENKVLSDAGLKITGKNGQEFALPGLCIIDQARLNQLSDQTLADWERKGILKLIHAHWLSLNGLADLAAQ